MNLFVPLVLSVCMAQTPPLADAVDALAKPTAGASEKYSVIENFPARDIVPEILHRAQHDPRFAPGTEAGELAIQVLAWTRDDSGRNSVTDPGQVQLLAESYEWVGVETQLSILQAITHIDPSLRHHMTEALSAAIQSGNEPLTMAGLLMTSRAGVSVNEPAKAIIRELFIGVVPYRSLWDHDYSKRPWYHRLHSVAVASYLSIDDDVSKWRETRNLAPHLRPSAIIGVVEVIVDRAHLGKLRTVEREAFDTLLELASHPPAAAALEREAYLLLTRNADQPSPDRDSLFRGLVRLVAECGECSDEVKQAATRSINVYMATALESPVPQAPGDDEPVHAP